MRDFGMGWHQNLWGSGCLGLSGLSCIIVGKPVIPFLDERSEPAVEARGFGFEAAIARSASSTASADDSTIHDEMRSPARYCSPQLIRLPAFKAMYGEKS